MRMAAFRTLLILFGALAVLTLGATPMATAAEAPPCHSQEHQAPTDQPASKALKVMNCCVACVAAPRPEPAAGPVTFTPPAATYHVPASTLTGLSPSPAHGPPRV